MGNWSRQDGATRIRIAPCGDKLCAVNTWVRDPDGAEKAGDTLVMTLQPKSETVLAGEAFDERRRMTYVMTLSFEKEGMRTQGCVLLGMLCKTAAWTRTP